jgi:hypothetical protein
MREAAVMSLSGRSGRPCGTLPVLGSRERMTRDAKKLGVELEESRTSRAVRLNGTDLAGSI